MGCQPIGLEEDWGGPFLCLPSVSQCGLISCGLHGAPLCATLVIACNSEGTPGDQPSVRSDAYRDLNQPGISLEHTLSGSKMEAGIWEPVAGFSRFRQCNRLGTVELGGLHA